MRVAALKWGSLHIDAGRASWTAVSVLLAVLWGCAASRSAAIAPGNVQQTPSGERWVDLLPMAGESVAVAGEWTLEDGSLVVDAAPAARIAFPYKPPEEYDFLIEFTLSQASGCTAQLLSRGDTPFTWSMNAGIPPYCRLEDIGGHSVRGNPTLKPYDWQAGKRYTSVVSVRRDRVTCRINDEEIVDYRTDFGDLSRNPKWQMRDQLQLGVGAWNGPTTFHRVAVREIAAKK